MATFETSMATFDCPNLIHLYRLEAVETVHVLPIPPPMLPRLCSTNKRDEKPFLRNLIGVIDYYGSTIQILKYLGQTQEVEDLQTRQRRLFKILDGLDTNCVAFLTAMEEKLSQYDEDQQYELVKNTSIFKTVVEGCLPRVFPSTTPSADVIEGRLEGLEGPATSALDVSPVEEKNEVSVEDKLEDDLATQQTSEAVVSPSNVHEDLAADAAHATIGFTPEEPEQEASGDSSTNAEPQQPTLKRTFDEMFESASEHEIHDDGVEYGQETDDDDEVIIITEGPEEMADDCQSASDEEVEMSISDGESVVGGPRTEELDESIPLLRRLGIPMLNDWDIEEPIEATPSIEIDTARFIHQTILPDLDLVEDNSLLESIGEYSFQDDEETSGNIEEWFPSSSPTQPSPVQDIFSPALSSTEESSDESLIEEDASQCASQMSDENLAFLRDFYAAEDFLASSSDEEDDENPVTAILPPVKPQPIIELVGERTEGNSPTVPGAFQVEESEAEEAVASSERPRFSVGRILGATALIAIPMSIIYPTVTALVLFGIIRIARSRR